MLAQVTNLARSARGVEIADGSTRLLDPGETALLDLADHPVHRAWAAAGDLAVAPALAPPDRPPAVARDRTTRRPRP